MGIGWMVSGFMALMFLGFVRDMRKDAHRGQPVHIVEVTQSLLLSVLAVWR